MPKSGAKPQTLVGTWRLELIGNANLQGANIALKLERKTAGVLAYLALEGETTRSKLAGLLWSDAIEDRARANLRQCLYRLKQNLGTEILSNNDPVKLEQHVSVDAVQLESSSFLGDDGLALTKSGELLAGLDFEDQPDFLEWLEGSRERFRALSSEALRREIQRLEQNQDFPAALEQGERWVTREPLLEEAYRALMRLHTARGDRATALQVFQRCEETLARELGLQPSLETRNLLQNLGQNPAEFESSDQHLKLKLEQIMLVAGEDFEVQLAGKILQLDPIDLLTKLHDLKPNEHNALPSHLRPYLHTQIATQLEQLHANSARIAHHWLEAKEPEKAATYFLVSAQNAHEKHQLEEAVFFFEQALEADLNAGNQARGFETLFKATQLGLEFDLGELTENRTKRLFDLSRSGFQRAKAYLARADYQQVLGHNQQAEKDAKAGIEVLRGNQDLEVEAALYSVLSSTLWAQSKLEEALRVGEHVVQLNQQMGLLPELATSYANLASIYLDMQNQPAGIAHYEKALAIRCQLENHLAEAQTRVNLAVAQAQLGLADSSLTHLELAKNLLEKTSDAPVQMMQCLNEIAQRNLGFAKFDLALAWFEKSVQIGQSLRHWATVTVQSNQVFALITLGAFGKAQAMLEELLEIPELRPSQRFGLLRLKAMIYRQTQCDASNIVIELEQQVMPEPVIKRVKLDRLSEFSNNDQLELCKSLLETAQKAGLYGSQIIVQTKLAQALMLHNPSQALDASLQATRLLEQYTPIMFYHAETRLTYFQALKANQLTAEALSQLEKTMRWLSNINKEHVPPEYQQSFLNQNPINKAILDAARDSGISIL